MICRACVEGRHQECEGASCSCRLEEEQIERSLRATRLDCEALADTIYCNLMSGGCDVPRKLADAVGAANLKTLVRLVLLSNRSLKC